MMIKMAGVERLELPTIGFGDRCSTNWNYTPIFCLIIFNKTIKAIVTLVGSILFFRELRDTREVRRYYTQRDILLKDYFYIQ